MPDLRALIVDDEPLARQRLRRLLAKDPEVKIVGECADGATALKAARSQNPDLLLLDIQMPGMDGFGVVEGLPPGEAPVVVFVTAFDEHAVHAFEACALDYLLKPVSPARLAKALARVRKHLTAMRANPPAQPSEDTSTIAPKFLVRCGQRTSFVSPDEIEWIEADGNYAILHSGGRNHFLRATLSALETQLPTHFFRASRSAILNLRCVKELQSAGGNHFAVMTDDSKAPLTCGVRTVEERLRSL
ncbi:MAG TPA: LytTR family DNA-binding domain-containing protein [Chthoniobacterales bacterium]|nr:LytTR family DNA-binding domain-containing protein [Chthoniobacterales bacterium]